MTQNGFTLEDIPAVQRPPDLEWDWDIEHEDRKREAGADVVSQHAPASFDVDRKILKDVVREKMNTEVGRITFMSAGTFHKAYLVTLVNHRELVARVARRFMPRLKTESEVATMKYVSEQTAIPVPHVYHYDSNPYNRLGGEFILMSKAPGIPLSKVYHSLPHTDLVKLLENLADMLIPLFSHRFSLLGSLYFGPAPQPSSLPTPKAQQQPYSAFPFSPTLSSSHFGQDTPKALKTLAHIGPIIAWPYFGTNRGDLRHPDELDRGPWSSTTAYFESCAQREITGVIRENEGKAAPHKLHLDPDEIQSSRHHHLKAVPGDCSDESDEWDLEESEEEWEGPGDVMYRDYRRMQRSTFLVAEMVKREECVRKEMARWIGLMDRLLKPTSGPEEFGLDCHDLSLENIFVDSIDNSKITCIIDWESTTTRPLWQAAHLPAFLQSSPFIATLFREAVARLASSTAHSPIASLTVKNGYSISSLAKDWLHYEHAGIRLRLAHRFVEWDGWEEGLMESIIGDEEHEDDWFKDTGEEAVALTSPPQSAGLVVAAAIKRKKLPAKLPFAKEKEQEQMLTTNGDYCGGIGGELGRRLDAWLSVAQNDKGDIPTPEPRVAWLGEPDDEGYEAETE